MFFDVFWAHQIKLSEIYSVCSVSWNTRKAENFYLILSYLSQVHSSARKAKFILSLNFSFQESSAIFSYFVITFLRSIQ